MDSAHPGHRYGLVHFDWHGPMPPPPPTTNPQSPCTQCPCPPQAGDPIDLASGIAVMTAIDIAVNGPRGSVSIARTYRTLSSTAGPFGIGTNHNYGYQLGTFGFIRGQGVIQLIMPDGNQFPFTLQPNGTLINTTIPSLRGAVLTNPSSGVYNLRWKDGTTYQFQSTAGGGVAFLISITDPNGNVITLTLNPSVPGQVTQVTDPVGRSLTLHYDASNRVTSIVDPMGRTVQYTYNAQGTLASVTDPAGSVTTYAYDPQKTQLLTSVTDPRGVVVAQNLYDVNGRVVQQIQADGGVIRLAYTLLNSTAPTVSPVLRTVVTDPQGNQTTYHFDPQGLLLDVTDATGQMRIFSRDPGRGNVVTAITINPDQCPGKYHHSHLRTEFQQNYCHCRPVGQRHEIHIRRTRQSADAHRREWPHDDFRIQRVRASHPDHRSAESDNDTFLRWPWQPDFDHRPAREHHFYCLRRHFSAHPNG